MLLTFNIITSSAALGSSSIHSNIWFINRSTDLELFMTFHPGITSDLREAFHAGSTFLIGGELYPRIVSPPYGAVSLLTHSLPSFVY